MPVQLEAAAERARARIGTLLNHKWRLEHLLGVGGMAAVYAATHHAHKRAAIKILHPELSLDAAIRKRFLREGYVANAIGQRGAVAVDYDDVSEEGLAFLVMELLDGETIEQRWLRKDRRLSANEALSVADQLLSTLAAAHAQGIVHRDLKPGNVFLTRDGTVKVLDFGIARVRELSSPLSTTLAGSAMGTPAFMAPEQARGRWEEVDGRTDLWAVGATLYTLLSGKFVHSGDTASEILAMATTRPARSLGVRRPDLHQSLIRFVDKALAYDKAARFGDAANMQYALRVTFAEINGRAVTDARQLGLPDLQPTPTARAITIRNLNAFDVLDMSGQPTAGRAFSLKSHSHRQSQPRAPLTPARVSVLTPTLWLGIAIGAAFLLIGTAWLSSRAPASIPATPTARSSAQSPSSEPAALPQPSTAPEPVRLDDLPQELPARVRAPKKALPRR